MLKKILATLGPQSAKATAAGVNTFGLVAVLQVLLNVAERIGEPTAGSFLDGFGSGLGTSAHEAGVILGTSFGAAVLNYVRTWNAPANTPMS